jgi:outer membrane receptor for ferrienterochelin and colicins
MSSARMSLLAVVLCALAVTAEASADEASEAQLQYELGAELYKQGRYAEAIDRFIASQRLVPNANVVLNIARTFGYLERNVEAYNWYQTFLRLSRDEAKKREVEGTLQQMSGKVAALDVSTEPPGAKLYVDRLELGAVGESPRRIAVAPGERTIIARLDRHRDSQSTVSAAMGSVQSVSLKLAARIGTLKVVSAPAGARVRAEADGRELGTTPLTIGLPVGEQRVVIALAGFVEQTRSASIVDGAETALDVRLERAASSVSVLTVRGNVDGANLFLDDQWLGRAPSTFQDAAPGRRRVRVTAQGRDQWTGDVMLEPGAATRVDFHLADPKDRPWTGWRYIGFGTGGALLAAGGIVGAMALDASNDFDDEPSREKLDTIDARNTAADVLLVSGVVVIGATLAWELLRSRPVESSAKVTIDR